MRFAPPQENRARCRSDALLLILFYALWGISGFTTYWRSGGSEIERAAGFLALLFPALWLTLSGRLIRDLWRPGSVPAVRIEESRRDTLRSQRRGLASCLLIPLVEFLALGSTHTLRVYLIGAAAHLIGELLLWRVGRHLGAPPPQSAPPDPSLAAPLQSLDRMRRLALGECLVGLLLFGGFCWLRADELADGRWQRTLLGLYILLIQPRTQQDSLAAWRRELTAAATALPEDRDWRLEVLRPRIQEGVDHLRSIALIAPVPVILELGLSGTAWTLLAVAYGLLCFLPFELWYRRFVRTLTTL